MGIVGRRTQAKCESDLKGKIFRELVAVLQELHRRTSEHDISSSLNLIKRNNMMDPGHLKTIYIALLMMILCLHIYTGHAPLFIYVVLVGALVVMFYYEAKDQN